MADTRTNADVLDDLARFQRELIAAVRSSAPTLPDEQWLAKRQCEAEALAAGAAALRHAITAAELKVLIEALTTDRLDGVVVNDPKNALLDSVVLKLQRLAD